MNPRTVANVFPKMSTIPEPIWGRFYQGEVPPIDEEKRFQTQNFLSYDFQRFLCSHGKGLRIGVQNQNELWIQFGETDFARMLLDQDYIVGPELWNVRPTFTNRTTLQLKWTSSLNTVRMVTYTFSQDFLQLTVHFSKVLVQEVVDGPAPAPQHDNQSPSVPPSSSSYVYPPHLDPANHTYNVETIINMTRMD